MNHTTTSVADHPAACIHAFLSALGALLFALFAFREPDGLITVEAAGLEEATSRALIASGELPSRKLGRRTYVRRSDVLRLITAKPLTRQTRQTCRTGSGEYEAMIARGAA